MTQATTYPFSKFLVKIGDGASPEVFTDPCGLTTKGLTRTANLNDTNVPDCDDPDAPSWLGRDVVSYQAAIAGAGVVAQESFANWEEWWNAGETRNVKIELGTPAEFAWTMPAKLQEFAITAERGNKVQMTVAIVSDGAVVPVVIP
jgi:Phage tail tube protein